MIDSIASFIAEYGPRILVVWCLLAFAFGPFLGRWLRACSDGSVHEQRRKRSGQRNGAIGAVHGERNAAILDANHGA